MTSARSLANAGTRGVYPNRNSAFSSLAILLLVTPLLAACGDNGTGPGNGGTGSVEVSLIMSGDLDPDGCTFTLEEGQTKRVAPGQSTVFHDVLPGAHIVTIGDVAVNCETEGSQSRTIMVVAGQAVQETFTVACDWRTRIAFASDRDGNWEIYTVNPDGTDAVNLTNNPAADRHPSWSPDGHLIAFTSDRDGNDEIYLMNADGTNPINLTSDPSADTEPAWSPAGGQIAFWSNRELFEGSTLGDVFVMSADGTDAKRVSNIIAYGHSPVWSPDGSRIAYNGFDHDHRNWDLFVVDADGTGGYALTDNPGPGNDRSPTWSPDGSRIAFSSYRTLNDGSNEDIYILNADGTGEVRLTDHPMEDKRPAWSPDGNRIAFTSHRDGDPAIYGMNADGTNQVSLSDATYNIEYRPVSWSPDGTDVAVSIAYSADLSSRQFDIYLLRADGTSSLNVSNNPGHDTYPVWSPILY